MADIYSLINSINCDHVTKVWLQDLFFDIENGIDKEWHERQFEDYLDLKYDNFNQKVNAYLGSQNQKQKIAEYLCQE